MPYLVQVKKGNIAQEKGRKCARKFYREIEDYKHLTPEERKERVVTILSEAVIKYIHQKALDSKESGNKRGYSGNQ